MIKRKMFQSKLFNFVKPSFILQNASFKYKKVDPSIIDREIDANDPKKAQLDKTKLKALLRDRRQPISYLKSIEYLNSETYKKNYGKFKVWELYRRAHMRQFHVLPQLTRIRCIEDGFVNNNSPCPICRDKYLIIHEKNIKLLEQFINPVSENVFEIRKVQLCQEKYEDLLFAIEIARDLGYLKFKIPFSEINYSDYYGKEILENYKEELIEENLLEEKLNSVFDPTEKPYESTRVFI